MVFWLRRSSHLEKVWLVSTKRKDAAATTRESHGIKESEMKFEMEFGYFNDKLVIETHDFDMIKIFHEFVQFQEAHGWAVNYEAVAPLDFEDDEDEEIPPFALNTHEPL
jgi:hypothetical protein